MTISDLKEVEALDCLQGYCENIPIVAGYTSDLLSDVMANAEESSVLITIQAHKNTIAVASLVGIGVIIFCNDCNVPDDVLMAAKDNEIALFQTAENQFETTLLIGRCLAETSSDV